MSLFLGSLLLFAVFGIVIGLFTAIGYLRNREKDPGLTTEIALIATYLLGGIAMQERPLAAALAVVITILLAARTRLHDWVKNVLTPQEAHDGLMLAAAALVVLPLIPSEPVDPWGIVSLRQLWALVVLIMAINAVGYIALRILGAKIGLALAGLLSGFVSSTATIGAMGTRTRKHPELHAGAVAGAAASSVATIIQLAVLIGLVSFTVLRELILALVAAGVAALIYAAFFTWRSAKRAPDGEPPAGRPFDPKTALLFVAIVGITLVISAGLTYWLGERGLLLASAVSGFSDAHAPAISAATLANSDRASMEYAGLAVLVALTSNTISKAIVAFSLGTRQFAFELLPGLMLMIVSAWAGWAARNWINL